MVRSVRLAGEGAGRNLAGVFATLEGLAAHLGPAGGGLYLQDRGLRERRRSQVTKKDRVEGARCARHYMANDIATTSTGMMSAIPEPDWRIFSTMRVPVLAETLMN